MTILMDSVPEEVQGFPPLRAAEAEQADAGGGDEADRHEPGEVLPGPCQGDGPVKQQDACHQEGDQERTGVGVTQEPEHLEPELCPEDDELDDLGIELGEDCSYFVPVDSVEELWETYGISV